MENPLVCPVERTIRLIAGKWTLLILRELLGGKRRFGEMLRALPGISPKTLALRLGELEENGILTRRVYPEVPPRVEYCLTEKGRSLGRVIQYLDEWTTQWEKTAEPTLAR